MSDASSSRTGLLRGVVVLAIAALGAACQHEDVRSFQGYAQGETIRLAAAYSGNLSKLSAKRGAKVTEGTTLFSLADEGEVAAYDAAKKRLVELTRRRGPARDTAEIESLKAQVAQTQLKLAQKSANAPADAVIVETLYAQGDWVPAGAPVVTILPVDKITVRFAVPLAVAAHLQNGRKVTLICEHCGGTPVRATVTHVSPFAQPESQTEGLEALRYMVEARPNPAQATLLIPGQPVTVVL